MQPESFEEVRRQFSLALEAHRQAELKFTRMLQHLGRTDGLDHPVDDSLRQALNELEQDVDSTLAVYEDRLHDLVEAIRQRRARFLCN